MRQRFSQSYHIFDSSLTRVKGTVKVISIFDLAFDKNQMCDKSNFSCRVKDGRYLNTKKRKRNLLAVRTAACLRYAFTPVCLRLASSSFRLAFICWLADSPLYISFVSVVSPFRCFGCKVRKCSQRQLFFATAIDETTESCNKFASTMFTFIFFIID